LQNTSIQLFFVKLFFLNVRCVLVDFKPYFMLSDRTVMGWPFNKICISLKFTQKHFLADVNGQFLASPSTSISPSTSTSPTSSSLLLAPTTVKGQSSTGSRASYAHLYLPSCRLNTFACVYIFLCVGLKLFLRTYM